jgi:putative inorganic carbon (hco3(-)) transporter
MWLATGAAVSVVFSNAVCQILLGAALVAVLAAHRTLRFPPIRLPLALFVAGTVIALLFSADPRAGLPQLKKFYVFLMLPVLYTALRSVHNVRTIVVFWGAIAAASGLWSFVQFMQKRSAAAASGEEFYTTYVARRVTGLMSHWMTFSAEQMMAGLLLAALVMFGAVRWRATSLALVVILSSIVLAWTRSVWIGTAVGACYLIAVWRPKLLLAVPLVACLVFLAAPESTRQRLTSLYKPHGTTDSNEHRRVTFYTGVEMVKAHPVLGLGPEMPGRQFEQYIPPFISRPLPDGFYGHLHNVYLQYAAERGLPTLFALLWLITTALRDFWRNAVRTADSLRRAVLHGAIAAMAGLLVEGLFEHNLGDSEVLTMFLVVVAGGYIACSVDTGTDATKAAAS